MKAGLLWFDLSQVPPDAQIHDATLLLTINEAPATPIEVEARDLSVDPRSIDSSNANECQSAFDDACSGNLYASFNVDSSQVTIEIPLSPLAVADIQAALQSGNGFGIGLRAPTADASNFVAVSFKMSVYIRLKYW